jgi:peptidyl-prolyl cis-trans isomerase C
VKTRIALFLIAVALTGAACKKNPADAAKTPATAPGSAAVGQASGAGVKPVPTILPELVARVNGSTIDRGEFERAIKSLETQAGGPVPAEQRDTVYRQLLDQLVALRLLSQESAAKKVAVPETEIDGQFNKVKGNFPNEQAFTAALAQRQMTPDKLKAEIRQQAQAMKLVQTEIEPTVSVTDADVNDFYTKNPDKFHEPEAVHVSHILIRTPDNADEAAKKKARAEAQGVLAQIKKGGDFAALAKEHSQDPGSAANGGDLGFVPRGQTVPAFEQAAFALKDGQLSGVVESPFGCHIIKAIQHRAARTIPLAEVKPQVEQFLKQQQVQQKTAAYVNKLKAKAKLEILI